jgi:hypothetical protein
VSTTAGASWSSVDYGGVWKPVHYGVARAFADVSLSVQHDLQADTLSVSRGLGRVCLSFRTWAALSPCQELCSFCLSCAVRVQALLHMADDSALPCRC